MVHGRGPCVPVRDFLAENRDREFYAEYGDLPQSVFPSRESNDDAQVLL